MTSVDWEEVKRLAADFQKAQLSFSLQKLSERNCVEIITKLTEAKLLNIIFTNDGKEYVTPQHLEKEIKDELYVHGGRINLVELAKILNVDLSQISKSVNDIEKHDKSLKLILGQLIDRNYMIRIAGEINDKLSQQGHINVSDLTLKYDLPAEFIQSLLEKELGKIVFGKQDSQDLKVFYTEGYVARNRAKVRGALSAITKPTPLSAILGQCAVPERIFFSILENLQEMMQVPGVVTGKQGGNSIYVPSIYSKSQSEWVDNFYKQNGYLEYDALSRLGISDPKNFVKRHFPNENLTLLDTVAVGSTILDQVDANIDETLATETFMDIYPLLPSVFSSSDVETILKETLKRTKRNIHIYASTVIVSEAFLQNLYKKLESLAEKKANELVDSGKWLQSIAENRLKSKPTEIIDTKTDRKAERRKKASSGKSGGGAQGRETKTKSTKKKFHQGKNNDSDEENASYSNVKQELTFIAVVDIAKELKKDSNIADIDEFVDELAAYLQILLNKHVMQVAEQLMQKSKNTNLNEIEDRLNMIAVNIRVFDKGIKHLEKSVQSSMIKYLLKTLGLDFVTEIFKLACNQNVIQCPNNLTTEARQKLLLEFPKDIKESLGELHRSVIGESVEDFLNSIESAMIACCLVLRKYDKKKDRPIIVGHREALLDQINSTQDPALALHLATNILFIVATQSALHMSGRHVSSILTFLQTHLELEAMSILTKYHDLVLKLLSSSEEAEKAANLSLLDEGLSEIKNIANEAKKYVKTDKSHD
ncbi:E3 UFM1-protein ligase 1 homolog [Leptopilina heterotoma]|uniref:E3 UFM1-protein ligase 1 homolog n=1 Tax=Leptopilina heterotoma TaxID=63436 RepID=UPI001CA90979|nr:E3 UFM1-protein ligase 1 homolog [Leptopilina heterotoma]